MNSTKLKGSSTDAPTTSSRVGMKSKVSGKVFTANIELDDYRALAPIFIPDLEIVRAFAQQLHAQRKAWQGEAFGWNAGYNPSSSEPPPESKMTFTPADFWIGDGAIWFLALMWEDGDDQPPAETLYDKNVVGILDIGHISN